MASKNVDLGQELVQMSTEELAQELVKIYQNFNSNRNKIAQEIDTFIQKAEINQALIVHATNANYTLLNPNIDYFIEGHALINKIRVLLGQEEVTFRIGILNQIDNKFSQVDLTEEQAAVYMRSRGNDKMGLSHSQSTIDELLNQYENTLNAQNINDKFFKFLNILENKTKEKGTNLNYGYAFEAFGHFEFLNGKFKGTRHETYYNYYRASRKNLAAWTTGGDVGNVQYKLIRIYRDAQGTKQISSASVSSAKTILKELNLLSSLLKENNTLTPDRIALKLAKDFTQLNIPKKLNDSIEKVIIESFKTAGIELT